MENTDFYFPQANGWQPVAWLVTGTGENLLEATPRAEPEPRSS